MFKQTVSLLRRMVGGEAAAAGCVEEDRRVWGRFPSAVETTFRPLSAAPDTRVAAKVDNISRGGIRLVAERPLEPGTMLAVDLPGPGDGNPYTVLACVAHLGDRGDGRWRLGCTFCQELSEDELRAFGAERARPPSPDDQRSWARFPCRTRASCRPAVTPEVPATPVEVLNISPSGIGLLTDSAVETGALLSLDLYDGDGRLATTMLACVVHVHAQAGDRWALGCNFIRELSEQELNALL